jgi:putative FmdB family regulatory protein
MPTYVYACSKCNSQFEAVQRITEDPLNTCECGSVGTVKRVIQPIAVMFKGSGFHINDYAPGGKDAPKSAPTASADPAPAATTEGAAPAKESTPAPAAPAAPDTASSS